MGRHLFLLGGAVVEVVVVVQVGGLVNGYDVSPGYLMNPLGEQEWNWQGA